MIITGSGSRARDENTSDRNVGSSHSKGKGKSGKQKAKKRASDKKHYTLKNLMDAGKILPGEGVLKIRYKTDWLSADALPDGRARFQGVDYLSMSGLAIAAIRPFNPSKMACNGWKSVFYKNASLHGIREALYSEEAEGAVAIEKEGGKGRKKRSVEGDDKTSLSSEIKVKKVRRSKPRWIKTRTKAAKLLELEVPAKQLIESGYTVLRDVLTAEQIHTLMHKAEDMSSFEQGRRSSRKRSGTQGWYGAVKTLNAHIRSNGSTETVLAPVATRAKGRYDLPLPHRIASQMSNMLRAGRLWTLLKTMCPRGSLRTQNIMLSKPGSQRQQVHTDSSWDDLRSEFHPSPHYYTILIPLTETDHLTGCTRIWPDTHIEPKTWAYAHDPSSRFIDTYGSSFAKAGDAIVFDGLLLHCGLENRSDSEGVGKIAEGVSPDRYFYYAAFSSIHDPNTEVTGV